MTDPVNHPSGDVVRRQPHPGPAELLDEASRPLMASVAGNAFLETKVQSTLLRIKHERSRGRLPLETSSRAGEK